MIPSTLLSAHQASKRLGVSARTFRRWHAQGRITAERTYSGVRLYDVNHVLSTPVLCSSASANPSEQPSKYMSPAPSNEAISNDRSNASNSYILPISSLQISSFSLSFPES